MSKKTIVQLITSIGVVFLSLVFWLTWQTSIEVSINITIYLIGILLYIPLITGINILFLQEHKNYVILVIALAMLPILFIGRSFIVFAFSAYIVAIIGLLLSYQSFQKNKLLYIKLNTKHLSQSITIFIVLLISLSLLTIGNASLKKNTFRIKIPDQLISFVSTISSNLIKDKGNSIFDSSTMIGSQTLNGGIMRLESELVKKGIVNKSAINQQIEAIQNYSLDQVTNMIKQGNNQITLSVDDQIGAIKGSIENKINSLISPFAPYMPYLFGIFFFLQFIFLSFLFTWPSDLLFHILFKIFLSTGLGAIKTKSEEVEYFEM